MSYAVYLDLKVRIGNEDLGSYKTWLPTQPHGTPVKLASYPVDIPAWRIKARGPLGLKITVTVSISGEIGVYADGSNAPPPSELRTSSSHG